MKPGAILLAAIAAILGDATPQGALFRPETARLVDTIRVGNAAVYALAYPRDARRLVVLTTDGALSLWDLPSRRKVRQAADAFFNSRFALSADGTRALGVSADRKSIRLVDVERGQEIQGFTDALNVASVQPFALSPDGRRVALVKRDQSVRICDAATGADVKTLVEPGTSQAGSLAWSADGKLIAIHGWDATVRMFDAITGEMTGSFETLKRSAPLFMGFSPDSATLALVTGDARIHLHDRKGRELRALEDSLAGILPSVAFSPDGRLMAAADIEGRIRIWDVKTWRRIRDLDAGRVRHLAFSPDGRHLAVAGVDGTVQLWGGSGPAAPPPKPAAPRGGAPGFLGITGDPAGGAEGGVAIASVLAGTAAERAGLQVGDVIVKIGAVPTESFDSLRAAVTALREGDEIEIHYKRDGAEKKVKLKLGGRPPENE